MTSQQDNVSKNVKSKRKITSNHREVGKVHVEYHMAARPTMGTSYLSRMLRSIEMKMKVGENVDGGIGLNEDMSANEISNCNQMGRASLNQQMTSSITKFRLVFEW